ncbi:sensor histidine kinase [Dactylosporangium sp. AC04546]|uniref:sensor histidine kinase n=1 Tax=Dactylosporangium sp. AC04546 TaxID=2862460 RepID=UPI001EE04A66|nr:sensor histidine kinase [Dactylosporangium sp. AC04546]WVK83680.1 sensor histidine kinase [Dactylosporangium sp. AC04546]
MVHALLLRKPRRAERFAIDALLAAIAMLLCLYAARAEPEAGNPQESVWLSVLVAAAVGLPVAVRRWSPRVVAGAVSVAAAVALVSGIIPSFAAVAPSYAVILALYTLGADVPRRQSWPVAVACVALVLASLAGGDVLWPATELGGGQWLWSVTTSVGYAVLVIGPAYAIGYVVRVARQQNKRAAQQAVRQAATDERLRVARELHDVIAHTMTLIVVQASVGNHVADVSPEEARRALQAIEQTGRTAMAEVRRVLDVLREDGPGGAGGQPHGLDDLADLAERAAVGGVDVHLDVRRDGAVGKASTEVPADVALAVYRIVQEAVTNVVKHAAPTACRVDVLVGPAEVRVEVTDDGTRPPTISLAGHGLIGMRERTALHGGEFRAGPRSEGGFAVVARLPYGGGR